MRLGESSWTEARDAIAAGACAIIPLGSIEEHGQHMPMGDYMITDHIAGRTGEATGDLVVPTMPFGYCEYYRQYPGTITIRPETLAAVIEDTVDCLSRQGVRNFVIFNGHLGNAPILDLVTRKLRRTHGLMIPNFCPLVVMRDSELMAQYGVKPPPPSESGSSRMGSLMMVLAPGKVHMDAVGTFGHKTMFGMPSDAVDAIMFKGYRINVPIDVQEIAPESGSLHDPAGSTVERGHELLDATVRFCTEFMQWFRTVDPRVQAD